LEQRKSKYKKEKYAGKECEGSVKIGDWKNVGKYKRRCLEHINC
jgi:hypothetical protein